MKFLTIFSVVTLLTITFYSCGSDSAFNTSPYKLGQGLAINVLTNCDRNDNGVDMDCFFEKYKDYQPIIKMRNFSKNDLIEFEKGMKDEFSKNGINASYIKINE